MILCDIKTNINWYDNQKMRPVLDSSTVLWTIPDNGTPLTWKNMYGIDDLISSGASRINVDGKSLFGYGFNLNGINNYLYSNSTVFDMYDEFTIVMDIFPTALPNETSLISHAPNLGCGNYNFMVNNGRLNLLSSGPNCTWSNGGPNSSVLLNKWQQVGVTVKGALTNGTVKYFINGVPTDTFTGFIIGPIDGGPPFTVGKQIFATAAWYKGIIASTILYNRGLSDAEMAQNWNNSIANILSNSI